MHRVIVVATAAFLGLCATALCAEEIVFMGPAHDGYRVDVCRVWGSECGQAAAGAFCRLQGYEQATGFDVDHDIGATTPTRTLGDGKVCDQSFCDGFVAITCTRPGAGAQSSTPVGVAPWTAKDVMDPNIDVQAQYALFRMFKRPAPAWQSEASHILSAVKAGALKGIYQEDQQVPALRAQKLGKWWKQILPEGATGTCMKEPGPPIIVMRRGAPADREDYDAWLSLAWNECGIANPWPVRPYDPSAPGDPPATGTMQTCHGAARRAEALQVCKDLYGKSVNKCRRDYLERANGDPALAGTLEHTEAARGSCEQRFDAKFAACQQDAHAACQ